MSKYHSKKVLWNGMTFDSKKELKRYQELLLLQRAGKILGLARQQRYEIVPEHREPSTVGKRGGVKRGAIIERARYYVADFVYVIPETGQLVVEDCKGFRTAEYRLKKALMYDRYKIRITET